MLAEIPVPLDGQRLTHTFASVKVLPLPDKHFYIQSCFFTIVLQRTLCFDRTLATSQGTYIVYESYALPGHKGKF